MKQIGRVQHIIMIPIYIIPVSFEYLDPLKKISCVRTAPTFPPPPVIPDISPNDLKKRNRNEQRKQFSEKKYAFCVINHYKQIQDVSSCEGKLFSIILFSRILLSCPVPYRMNIQDIWSSVRKLLRNLYWTNSKPGREKTFCSSLFNSNFNQELWNPNQKLLLFSWVTTYGRNLTFVRQKAPPQMLVHMLLGRI